MKFETCTALVTPFDKNNKIDYPALKKLIDFQIENKIDAILILGTTGEAATISQKERKTIIKFCVEHIHKRCLLFVGTGSNSTAQATKLTRQAKIFGADAAVVVTPYYNKCTQLGLIEHYKAINKCKFPFIAYNVPSRTGVNIEPKTLTQLENLSHMIGLKEASGDINQILEVLHIHKKPVYSGNDKFNHLFLTHGGNGCISVASNVVPNLVVSAWQNKGGSLNLHNALFELNNLLFCEVNPIPVKFALNKLNLCENVLRKPLTILTEINQIKLNKCLKQIINKIN